MKWIAVFKEKTGERASFQKVGDTLQIQANAPIVINTTGEKLNGAVNVTINQFSKANDLSVKVTLILDLLLTGKCKAVPKPWKPEYGEAYWKWGTNVECAQFKRWNDASTDFACWKLGNCFKTKEEAETKGKEIMEKLVKEYEEA